MSDEKPQEVTLFQCKLDKSHCKHDWPEDEYGQIDDHARCTKCGQSFIAHIFMEMP